MDRPASLFSSVIVIAFLGALSAWFGFSMWKATPMMAQSEYLAVAQSSLDLGLAGWAIVAFMGLAVTWQSLKTSTGPKRWCAAAAALWGLLAAAAWFALTALMASMPVISPVSFSLMYRPLSSNVVSTASVDMVVMLVMYFSLLSERTGK